MAKDRREDTSAVPPKTEGDLSRFVWEPGDIEIVKPKAKKSLEDQAALESLKDVLNS